MLSQAYLRFGLWLQRRQLDSRVQGFSEVSEGAGGAALLAPRLSLQSPPPMAKPTAAADDPRARFLVKFEPGQTIFEQGLKGAEMFVIQDGQVEILRRDGPTERRLTLLEAGDFFGEMSVLEDLPRSATARAVTASKLLPIDASTFDQMLREHPEIAVRMMRKLSRRLRQHDGHARHI